MLNVITLYRLPVYSMSLEGNKMLSLSVSTSFLMISIEGVGDKNIL